MSGYEPAVGQLADDADVDLPMPGRRSRRMLRRHPLSVLVAIAAGGALGASARYGVGLALPQGRDDLPWATLLINVTGCLAIGALLVLILEVWVAHRLLRPFLGVGVLGAYTTFSTYVVEAQQLVRAGRPALALAYLVATVIAALAAVQLGITLTRASVRVAAKRRGGHR